MGREWSSREEGRPSSRAVARPPPPLQLPIPIGHYWHGFSTPCAPPWWHCFLAICLQVPSRPPQQRWQGQGGTMSHAVFVDDFLPPPPPAHWKVSCPYSLIQCGRARNCLGILPPRGISTTILFRVCIPTIWSGACCPKFLVIVAGDGGWWLGLFSLQSRTLFWRCGFFL